LKIEHKIHTDRYSLLKIN